MWSFGTAKEPRTVCDSLALPKNHDLYVAFGFQLTVLLFSAVATVSSRVFDGSLDCRTKLGGSSFTTTELVS